MKVAAVNHRKPDRCAFQRFGCVQPAETSPDEHHAMRGRCRHTRASPFACRGLACRNRDAVSWPYISWVVYHARGALPGGKPLPYGRGSVTVALISQGLLSRDRQGAVAVSQESPKRLSTPRHRARSEEFRQQVRLL